MNVDGTRELPTDALVQVAVVVDGGANAMALYLDGKLENTVALGADSSLRDASG